MTRKVRVFRDNPSAMQYGLIAGAVVIGIAALSALSAKAKGEIPPATGDPYGGGGKVPSGSTFTISSVDFPNLVHVGDSYWTTVTAQHLGPAGAYVYGFQLCPKHLGCMFGLHTTSTRTIEVGFTVTASAAYKTWTLKNYQVILPSTGSFGIGAFDVKAYIRGIGGNTLAERWLCGQTVTY